MKICHLTSVHDYDDIRIFHKECRCLSDAGYEVHLVAPTSPNTIINGVRLHGLNFKNNSRLNRISRTIWSIYEKAVAINADIYHLHDPELLIIGLLLKAKNKKVIYDAHEDFPKDILNKYWIPEGTRQLISWLSERIENIISRHLDLIVVANPLVCDRFVKIGCNMVNINNYPKKEELISVRVNRQSKQKTVCYLGSISDKRGIFEMLAALENTDVKLLLAGRFISEAQREQAMTMKGWQNVNELGQIDRQGVKQVLQESMAGLAVLHPTPSFIRALPTKMFEYMASAIPVIVSDIPSWKEIVDSNKCGFCVDPFEIEEIANAINRLVSNPEENRLMGENGQRAIIDKYNWENESRKLIQSYQDLFS